MKKTSRISTLFFWLTFVSGAVAQDGGTWQTLAPMPTARQELATAALNGKIYAIDGYDSSGTPTKHRRSLRSSDEHMEFSASDSPCLAPQ
jgi:N-acetylneuraminic acid mutarotase